MRNTGKGTLVDTEEDEVTTGPTDFSVYPSPARDQIQVELALPTLQNVVIEFVDPEAGVLDVIHKGDWQAGTLPYDVSQYKPGLYLVKVTSDALNDTRRVMILDAH